MIVFFQIKKCLKKVFPTKKFYFDLNVIIFEAFHQLFVKKNRENRERRKRNQNIHINYNMEKSLRECEQITHVIVLYPGTKFELICPARKSSKSNQF